MDNRALMSLTKALEGGTPPKAIVVSRDVFDLIKAEYGGASDPFAATPPPFVGSLWGIQLLVSDLMPEGTMYLVQAGDALGLANPVAAAEMAVRQSQEQKPLKEPDPYADIHYIDPRTYRAYNRHKEFLLELDAEGAVQMASQHPHIEWKEIGP